MPPPADVAIDAAVSLNQNSDGYALSARLTVHLPGLDRGAARLLVDAAHATCPYSKATRGNIAVELILADDARAST
jgi:organic hydroperoxide reductase OsmC/OhrA